MILQSACDAVRYDSEHVVSGKIEYCSPITGVVMLSTNCRNADANTSRQIAPAMFAYMLFGPLSCMQAAVLQVSASHAIASAAETQVLLLWLVESCQA